MVKSFSYKDDREPNIKLWLLSPLFYALLCDAGAGILHITFSLHQLALYWAPLVGDLGRRLEDRRKRENLPFPRACSFSQHYLRKGSSLWQKETISSLQNFFPTSSVTSSLCLLKVVELARLDPLLRSESQLHIVSSLSL